MRTRKETGVAAQPLREGLRTTKRWRKAGDSRRGRHASGRGDGMEMAARHSGAPVLHRKFDDVLDACHAVILDTVMCGRGSRAAGDPDAAGGCALARPALPASDRHASQSPWRQSGALRLARPVRNATDLSHVRHFPSGRTSLPLLWYGWEGAGQTSRKQIFAP